MQRQDNSIGDYRIGRTLGIGAFGRVYMAIHVATLRRVAIKMINKRRLRTTEMQSQVESEISILSSFNHPHIIRLYEVLHHESDTLAVMEYLSKGALFDFIATQGRLSTAEARKFFQQLICAAEYCHYKGIVHRDLKPENILLDDDNNIHITSFDVASKVKDGVLLSKTSVGSPNYAAPEVISGVPHEGPAADVWSCGVILYAMLCGSLPFDDDNMANLFRKIKSGNFVRVRHIPAGALDLISKMLVIDPVQRISISQIKQHWWFQLYLPRSLRCHCAHAAGVAQFMKQYGLANKTPQQLMPRL